MPIRKELDMNAHRISIIVLPLALAIGLTACGGGGAPTVVVSAPIPPQTPTPAPTTAAASIGAPALAAAPNAALFPAAVEGGPTIMAHPKTVFPLFQSVVSIGPAGVAADTTTINAGATLAFDSSDSSYEIAIQNAALGVSNVVLNSTPSGVFEADVAGGKHVSLEIADPATSNLSWTSFGFWDVVMTNGARTQAQFVTGYATPAGAVPTTGTATYAGPVRGEVILPQAGRENGVNYGALSGDASLVTNFGNGSITGNLVNMFSTDFDGNKLPWNSVSLSGTLFAQNMFSGTSAATSAPGNSAALKGTATGTFAGAFFGPRVEELGAVWTLSDGTAAAFGTIGAKGVSNDACAGCWDY